MEIKKTDGWSRKKYLELSTPTSEDNVSDQERIARKLRKEYGDIRFSLSALRKLYPLCYKTGWKITLLLVWNGNDWEVEDVEEGKYCFKEKSGRKLKRYWMAWLISSLALWTIFYISWWRQRQSPIQICTAIPVWKKN